MRYFLSLFLILVIMPVTATAEEQTYRTAQFIPQIFKKNKDKEPLSEEDLIAPFAKGKEKADGNGGADIGVPYAGPLQSSNDVKLDTPHRTPEQVRHWLTEVIATVLTFNPNRYERHKRELESVMDPTAILEFDRQIKNSNLLTYLSSNNIELVSIVESFNDNEHLQNRDVLGGRYRWLYKVPVTLTFLPIGMSSYEDRSPLSKQVYVFAQVGRIQKDEQHPYELLLESWEMADRPAP